MRGSPKEGEMKQEIINSIENAAMISGSTFAWGIQVCKLEHFFPEGQERQQRFLPIFERDTDIPFNVIYRIGKCGGEMFTSVTRAL